MKKLQSAEMEMIHGGGNFWKCALKVGGGMISGGGTGFAIGSSLLPGFGSAFGAALGVYMGGIAAGLKSSDCMD